MAVPITLRPTMSQKSQGMNASLPRYLVLMPCCPVRSANPGQRLRSSHPNKWDRSRLIDRINGTVTSKKRTVIQTNMRVDATAGGNTSLSSAIGPKANRKSAMRTAEYLAFM